MSYMGNVELKASNIRRFDVTGSTSATHTLTWTAPNEQSLIVTINGVKQQNNYTVSGTTLTLDTPLITTDALEVIGINDVGTTITPAQGSVNADQLATDAVSTVKIEDDAVTADKLANSINTDIAANTAKVTNATHTGDVTGATVLTIANDAVDIAMLSATGTADATTFLRGDNSWVVPTDTGGLYESWALITDEKAQNTYGQTITGGAWRTREVQTEVYDPDGIVSIASDQFTIGPGTFLIIAHPLEQGGNAAQYRIYDDTNSAQVQLGLSYYGNNGTNDGTRDANIFGRVVIASGTVDYEVQVYNASGTTSSTNPSNVPSTTEHYMFIEIYKYA